MAQRIAGGAEFGAGRISGTVTGTGVPTGTPTTPGSAIALPVGPFTVLLSGTFVATIQVEVSLDGGTTWVPDTDMLGQPAQLTRPGLYRFSQAEPGTLTRLNCLAFTSGAPGWRISA